MTSMRPSSTRMSAAVLVIGLDIEAMRKMLSVRIGVPASRSWLPKAFRYSTLPWRATRATAPAICLRETESSNKASIWASLAESKPDASS